MNINEDLSIKQEVLDEAEIGIDSHGINFMGLDLDVKVENKIEYYDDIESFIKHNREIVKTENFIDYDNVSSFDDITEYSEGKCTLCDKYFENRYSLAKHNLRHIKVDLLRDTYECNNCSACYTDKDSLIRHIEQNHAIKVTKTNSKVQCYICKKYYKYKHWHAHMREVHCKARFECNFCDAMFKCVRYVRKHEMHMHGNVKWKKAKVLKKVKCPQCNLIYSNKHALKTHVRNCHTESVTCPICNSTLKCKSYYYAHLRRVHYDDGKSYQCEVCDKSFRSPRYLKIHQKNSGHLFDS